MNFRIPLFVVICQLNTTLLVAQEKRAHPNMVLAKATLLPYTIGNDGGFATSLGFEAIFLKHHAIGIDGFLHLAEGSHDNVTDTAGVTHEVGNYHHSTEKAFFIHYRYYFNYKNLSAGGTTIYVSPYYRYGYIERFNDPRYYVAYDYQKERSHAEGFLLGMIWNIKGFKRGYLDFNAGPFIKQKEITMAYREDNVMRSRFEKKQTVGCRIGIFFAYRLY